MHIHILYMHTYERSCEPCSKCCTSWHQIRNCFQGIAIVLLTHKQVMLMAYGLCAYLVFRGAYAHKSKEPVFVSNYIFTSAYECMIMHVCIDATL